MKNYKITNEELGMWKQYVILGEHSGWNGCT